jgi:hypothetical protein
LEQVEMVVSEALQYLEAVVLILYLALLPLPAAVVVVVCQMGFLVVAVVVLQMVASLVELVQLIKVTQVETQVEAHQTFLPLAVEVLGLLARRLPGVPQVPETVVTELRLQLVLHQFLMAVAVAVALMVEVQVQAELAAAELVE